MLSKYSKKIIIETLCNSHTMLQAIKISVVVGTILNIINQGDYIFNMMFEHINYFKMGFTYLVPFCVSTYTAISINMKLKIGDITMISTNLTCKLCQNSLQIEKKSIIPKCPECGLLGKWKASK